MGAFLVLSTSPEGRESMGRQIRIFPGGATPAMFPAATAFWIGYAFVPAPGDDGEADLLSDETRFELDVDGERALMTTALRQDATPVQRTDWVSFIDGLPAGWHEFAGRWYDGGSLVLSSRTSIEFVEP